MGAIDKVKGLYSWGDWQSGFFMLCGCRIQQDCDRARRRWGRISLNLKEYADGLEPVSIAAARRKLGKEAALPWELSKFRGACGALS